MEEPTGGDEAPRSAGRHARDGAVDFSGYSLAQLRELELLIDAGLQPLNHARLRAEIERRSSRSENEHGQPPGHGGGQFTSRDGWRGWLEAKRRRSPVFGNGHIDVDGDHLVLHGRQRTWLGVATQTVVRIPLAQVRNVAMDREWLRFEVRRRWLPARHVRFRADPASQPGDLVSRLPRRQTRNFQKRWDEIREFHERLESVGGATWPVHMIVWLNVAIFLAMAITQQIPGGFDPQWLVSLGANFGPATTDAQWWRLVSAQFLHVDALHVLANMWVLFNAGRLTSQLFGAPSFLIIYFGSGICGFVSSLAWEPGTVSVGASAGVFGVLAALLAFMARRHAQLPVSVMRAHWLSTLLFAVLNLASGFFAPTIDNAAHVGGLFGGAVLGWMLARPLVPEMRTRAPIGSMLASATFIAAFTLAGAWQTRGIGNEPNVYIRFSRAYPWYVDGESRHLQRWQAMAQELANGSISPAQAGRVFREEIRPFFDDAHRRLSDAESDESPADEFHALVRDFAGLRRDWAGALADAVEHRDQERQREALRLMAATAQVQAKIDRLNLRASMDYRPRALKHSLPFNSLRSWLSLDEWTCVHSPFDSTRKAHEDDSATDTPALRREVGCLAQRYFHERDYHALQSLLDQATHRLNDLPDGSSSLGAIISGLSSMISQGSFDIGNLLGRTADWRRAVEDPLMAELVEALILREWAWDARGHGFAKEVTDLSWQLFAHRSRMAAAALEAIAEPGAVSPIWHDLSLDVALDLSNDKDEIMAVFERGVRQFPNYLPLYQGMLRVLMPRWLGSHEDIDQFIVGQSRSKTADPDLALYARLYWLYFLMERDEYDIFTDARASWPDVDAGFVLLREQFPASDYLLNAHAALACMAHDRERYAELRPAIGRRMSGSAWSAKYSLAACDRRSRWKG